MVILHKFNGNSHLGLKVTKPVFGVFNQVRLNAACSAMETSLHDEILYEASLDSILCSEGNTKALIAQLVCSCSFHMKQSQVFSWRLFY